MVKKSISVLAQFILFYLHFIHASPRWLTLMKNSLAPPDNILKL